MTLLCVLCLVVVALLVCIDAYTPCEDIILYSFGKPLNDAFLGQYNKTTSSTGQTRQAFYNGQFYLSWTHFRGQYSRWHIQQTIGDDATTIAYKDSHALHPSEIARLRSLWRVYDSHSRKWLTDESLHVKCADDAFESSFEWKFDCLVLGVTNTHLEHASNLNALDYIKVSRQGFDATYESLSAGLTIQHHDGRDRWIIRRTSTAADGAREALASIESEHTFPNGIVEQQWYFADGRASKFLSVHCEVPEKQYYYQRLRDKYESCAATSTTDDEGMNEFSNAHFDMVVMHAVNEWSFAMSEDERYFVWTETASVDNSHSPKTLQIPSIGIGTAGINNDMEVIQWAVNDFGYELIDSASDHAPWYQNEHIIGSLLKRGTLQRDAFMVTTKLYAQDQGYEGAKHGLDDSLRALNVDAIDIYLIHHPHCDKTLCDGSWKTSWRVIEDYYFANKIKYVGVSNFDINEWHELLDWTRIPIAVVQNWFDPFHQNLYRSVIQECHHLSIVFQAYSLLATQWKYVGNGYRGNKDPVFSNAKLQQIATHYKDKSVAQIVLKWALQNKIAILPSSSKRHRIKQNLELFDFSLNTEDIKAIDQLA